MVTEVSVDCPELTDAVLVVHSPHRQFLLEVSGGGSDWASHSVVGPAPAHHCGHVVTEHATTGFSVVSQTGPEDTQLIGKYSLNFPQFWTVHKGGRLFLQSRIEGGDKSPERTKKRGESTFLDLSRPIQCWRF